MDINVLEFGQPIDVQQDSGSGQAHDHHWHQALTSCQNTGIRPMLVKTVERVVQ